ncbi:unnamed protein product, partial [Vitis vinifera]
MNLSINYLFQPSLNHFNCHYSRHFFLLPNPNSKSFSAHFGHTTTTIKLKFNGPDSPKPTSIHTKPASDVNPLPYSSLIQDCIDSNSFQRGKSIHTQMISNGYNPDAYLMTKILMLYARSGCLDDLCYARKLFEEMPERNLTAWNTMILAYARVDDYMEAWGIFDRMLKIGVCPDNFTFASALRVCGALRSRDGGKQVHSKLIACGFKGDTFVGNALIDMYAKCDDEESCLKVFDEMGERNQVTWNSIISAEAQFGHFNDALVLFLRMQESEDGIQPDQFTFTTLLTLCANQRNDNQGRQIHAHLIRANITKNIIVETELVHMYSECGRLNYAKEIFNRMAERNAYSWNSMIEGYQQNGETQEALRLFKQMQLNGIKPDCFSLSSMLSSCVSLSDSQKGRELHNFIVRNTMEEEGILQVVLVDMYAKCGSMDYAWKVYDQTIKKDRNTALWNSILAGYANKGLKKESFNHFLEMLESDIEYDVLTMVTIVNLLVLETALVDMYSKCGAITKARTVFDNMNGKNIVSWNAMISGYSKHGCSKEALILYEEMPKKGMYPNEVTFLAILSACSHTGLVEEGLRIFTSMQEDYNIEAKAEHYTCMVDLLGRAGRLEDAKEFVEKMPIEPEVSTWGALLGACRVHKDMDMGRLAAQRLFELDPQNPGPYVIMSNIYAAAGRWKEVEDIRQMMKMKGVKKDPGVSWIEINSEIQIFHAGSKTHPKTEEIYNNLRHLTLQSKGLGYIPDTSFILQNVKDIKEEEEEEYLLQHSERLALSLGLISLPKKSTIRVFKNLRICGDCHTATKFISKITGRRIIARDTNRFHHFENGKCSCGDYW